MSGTITEAYEALVAAGTIEPDPAQTAVLPEFDRIAAALETDLPHGLRTFFRRAPKAEPVKGLYLWGGVGRGKSMLMDLFFDTVKVSGKRRVHFHAFMQEVQSALHEVRKTGVDDAIKPVAEDIARGLRLLCFDEMQITDIADAMIVGRLFQHLFDKGVTVVTTSNRIPKDLYKDGLNRNLFLPFIALLERQMTVHELTSPRDYRQDRLAGEQVYFHPADKAARQKIAEIWSDLTDDKSAPLVLHVKGREVTIPAFRNGVGRSTFHALCGLPLGPADYLALADAVRVLVLEDIPSLSSENYNQARRFVTLIDALYEARVKVIATAAAAPENLYIEGEGSFEFERTASRLREMMSEGWSQG